MTSHRPPLPLRFTTPVFTGDLSQSADGFVGRYAQHGVCRGPGIDADNTDSGVVDEGHVVGRTIRFTAPNCDYDGHTPSDRDDRLDGHVACVISDPTTAFNFSGTWFAVR